MSIDENNVSGLAGERLECLFAAGRLLDVPALLFEG